MVPEESLSLLQFNVLNEIENIISDLNDEIAEKRNKLMSIEDLPSVNIYIYYIISINLFLSKKIILIQ